MIRKITLVTPGQPSSNPRLVKEAIALDAAGYSVTVLYNFWVDWADAPDLLLQKEYPAIKWQRVGGSPTQQRARYYYTRIRHKLFKIIQAVYPGNFYIQQNAAIRCNAELKRYAKHHKADLYIAHNLGALPAASIAAKTNNAVYAFDAEDYHRGQVAPSTNEYKLVKGIEDSCLPGVAYCTAASPLIAEKYAALCPALSPVVINNVFSKQYLPTSFKPYQKGTALKLFWFSQTVGKGRGLEDMIKAMGELKNTPISFTILGSCPGDMHYYLLQLAAASGINETQLHFLAPVPLSDIFSIAAEHHIGLAGETGYNINYQIALTNKLFVYMLSNLAVIATNTPAQGDFLNRHNGIGNTYDSGNEKGLSAILLQWYNDPQALDAARNRAGTIAATSLNWEEEQKLFLRLVAITLQK